MTKHPLSDELRKLAGEHQYPLVGWEQRLVETLHRAADALDELYAVVQQDGWCKTSALDAWVERAKKAEARVARLEEALQSIRDGWKHARNCDVVLARSGKDNDWGLCDCYRGVANIALAGDGGET